MESILSHRNLIVNKSSVHGLGVFAGEDIQQGEIIEECYSIIVPGKFPPLKNYFFHADENEAVVLGYGSIYNHAVEPNAEYFLDPNRSVVTFKAARNIKKDEEIFIDYGKNWFDQRKIKMRKLSFFNRLKKIMKKLSIFYRFGLVLSAILLAKFIFSF